MHLSTAITGFLLAKTVAGCSPNTLRNYKLTLARLQTHLSPADPELDSLTADDLRAFLAQLMSARFAPGGIAPRPAKPLAAKTIKNVHTCLCSLWTWAIDEGHAAQHVPRAVDVPKPEPPDIQPLTRRQVQALLEATAYSRPWATSPDTQTELPQWQRLRDGAILRVLLDTGIRASELCALTVADVDLTAGAARVRGKSRLNAGQGKERTVRLGSRTRKALWSYLAHREILDQPDAPLFATGDGRPYNRRMLRTHLHRLGERAGVPDVYPHRFRHTFAVGYLRNGGDIYTLQNLLGHTSLDMVRRYLALAEADAEAAHRRASPVDNWNL